MKHLLDFLHGYADLEFDRETLRAFLNFCNRSGIRLCRIWEGRETVRVRVRLSDAGKLCEYGLQCGVRLRVCARRGLPILLQRYRHRFGLWLGIVLFGTIVYTAPLFVWEIRVEGLDRLSRDYVCELLAEEGVRIGAFSPAIDRSRVYANILRRAPDISWLSVNLRGSTATVEIVERDVPQTTQMYADGANLIAARAGRIVGADIVRGALLVKNGDIVRAGALLVGGVLDSPLFGIRCLYAEGEVLAAVNDDYQIEIPLTCTARLYGEEKILEISVSVFGKSINIFKNYSISDANYDTIYRENNLPFSGLSRLPFFTATTVALPYTEQCVQLTEAEALARARIELKQRIAAEHAYAALLSREETYMIEDGMLIYRCSIEAIENIAAVAEFHVRADR